MYWIWDSFGNPSPISAARSCIDSVAAPESTCICSLSIFACKSVISDWISFFSKLAETVFAYVNSMRTSIIKHTTISATLLNAILRFAACAGCVLDGKAFVSTLARASLRCCRFLLWCGCMTLSHSPNSISFISLSLSIYVALFSLYFFRRKSMILDWIKCISIIN